MQYRIINQSYHDVHYIPMTYLFYNSKFVHFDPLHPFCPSPTPCLFFFFKFFIYLFMAVLGLRFCVRALSSCGKRGPLFIVVRGPLTIATSLVSEHRLQTHRLSNCGSRA